MAKTAAHTSDADAILDAGKELARKPEILTIGKNPVLMVPDGFTPHDAAKYLEAPLRTQAAVTLENPAAFTAYLKQFASHEHSLVLVDRHAGQYLALIDYHTAEGASWVDHKANLALTMTPSAAEWKATNQKELTQEAFLLFLEDHIPDIAEPDGATLMGVVMDFEALKTVSFSRSTRLKDGSVKFLYNETVQGNTSGGEIKVPDTFTLKLKPFEGTPEVTLTARLRYRINGGALVFWFDILRFKEAILAAIDDITEDLRHNLKDTVSGILEGKRNAAQ